MLTDVQGQLYLADQRGVAETDGFRSFHTFNFGPYQTEGRTPFGRLCVVNDDTLAAGRQLTRQIDEAMHVLILPLVGGIEVNSTVAGTSYASAGEALVLSMPANASYSVLNPYDTELINYLQIWVRAKPADSFTAGVTITAFDLAQPNQLLPAGSTAINVTIGQYGGREEDRMKVSDPETGLFAFVVEGAFEVQNRLLHARDSIALWDIDTVDFEALSNNALILFVDPA
ncbi:pirin family protein [Arsenicibacter rosenii]|uniref:Quercetin 2,3-dioxygenase C-terminal cupin domain-containing protein n=1 Tax=Arsenicibacter rosenii TaxID=1750698 RepID=A0A1S2VT87_9BACT|nr:hypothetical protein [Arsenicibacter rosenii]OIN61128.1 hypothetical protein BLX24_03430 [Arsenicibacter rosenii]